MVLHVCRAAAAGKRGLSLVEVAMALGIISFAMVVLLALLPVGMNLNRDSIEESRAMNLLQTIVADRKAAPLGQPSPIYHLPALSYASSSTTSTGQLWLSEDGTSNPGVENSLYQVNYTIYPASGVNQPAVISLMIRWPAVANLNASSRVETTATFLP